MKNRIGMTNNFAQRNSTKFFKAQFESYMNAHFMYAVHVTVKRVSSVSLDDKFIRHMMTAVILNLASNLGLHIN